MQYATPLAIAGVQSASSRQKPNHPVFSFFFFFNDPPTPEIYPLSLHDALPISSRPSMPGILRSVTRRSDPLPFRYSIAWGPEGNATTLYPSLRRAISMPRLFPSSSSMTRSEEHTSELQSLAYLVCRLLLEKKKT